MLTLAVLTVALIAAFIVELAFVVSSPAPLIAGVVALWLAAPGVAFVSRLVRGDRGARAASLLVGPVLGLAFSTLALLLVWSAGAPAWLAVLIAPAPVWLGAFALSPGFRSLFDLPTFGRPDAIALGVLLLIVPLTTLGPYGNVAASVGDGARAYRAYFTADFVWAMSVSAELAKGDVPPANPFLEGAGLNYYWLSHLVSGVNYRALQPIGARLEEVILVDAIGFSVVFIACLYWLARATGVSATGAAIGCAAGFLANSYEGLERLIALGNVRVAIELTRSVNIDAVSRWYYQGMPVDGLQRLLLYQPHHLTGYALALLALWLVARATTIARTSVALSAGVLLGAGFLFSTFTAIIVGLAVAMLYAVRAVRERAWRALAEGGLVAVAPVAVAVAIAVVLGYIDPTHGSLLHFFANPVALERWPLVLLLNFGPLLIGGVVGLVVSRGSRAEIAPVVALVAASLFFYFFADVPDMGGVWVGWRAGHLLLIGLGMLTGVAIDALRMQSRPIRWVGGCVAAVLFALAVPTVAIDVRNARDIANRDRMPLFPWTLVLSKAEIEGLEWIRRSTPPDAIVQVDPQARNAGTWAYIPAFAERRMAAGLPISMIPLRPYQLATDNVVFGIFHAPTAKDAWEMAHFLGISYLVIGDAEREANHDGEKILAADPALFRSAFHNDALTVYEVALR